MTSRLDCLVIGYYEPAFGEYEALIRQFGERSEAYRDLRYSFVDMDGAKLDYTGLLNYAYDATHAPRATVAKPTFLSGVIPNLAAVYLCAFLRRQGLAAEYVNLVAYDVERLRAYMEMKPTCVAITTTFYVLDHSVKEIVRIIRTHDSAVPIVVGGPLIANHFRQHHDLPSTLGRKAHVDPLGYALKGMGGDIYVVESQGEMTLSRLVRCLAEGRSPSTVPNTAYFEGDRLCVSPAVPEQNALDENIILWDQWSGASLGATIQTRTARICSFACAFCNYPTRAGKLALASVEAVGRELDSIQRVGGVKNVVFIDDTFNVPLPRFKQLCRLMKQRQYGLDWFSYLRCSNIDAEAVELMAQSGCRGVFLGIESGSSAVLRNMNKSATPEKYATGISMLRHHGILTFGSFIAGFPGETETTIEETYEFLEQHRPDYYRMQLWYCEPGTPIERQREQYGIVGQGFTWNHRTMNSHQAMDHIQAIFRSVRQSAWLPQWSFDFWIIPYLFGKGLTADQFGAFMASANELLALDMDGGPRAGVSDSRQDCTARMLAGAAEWKIQRGNESRLQ